MKLKFNHAYRPFFYSIIMDIDDEINNLNQFVNNKKIRPFKNYKHYARFTLSDKINYLLYVLELTYDNSEIEIYLEQLLKKYSVEEFNNLGMQNYSILCYMIDRHVNISLNSFEIIINFGIDVNKQDNTNKEVPLHFMYCKLLEHGRNVIELFVKYGANLNILNRQNRTILDEFIYTKPKKHLEIIIMLLVDFGAKINVPYPDTDKNVLEFIESYRSNNIKPAIKK